MKKVKNMKELMAAIKRNEITGCGSCEADFEEDDFAYAMETGECPYCHEVLEELVEKVL